MDCPQIIARAPLVPAALLMTAGIAADRLFSPAWFFFAGLAGLGILLWIVTPRRWLAGLALGIVGLAGLHHYQHRNVFAADDIGWIATDDARLVRLRGRLVDGPAIDRPPLRDPLRSVQGAVRTHFVLESESVVNDGHEQAISGRVAVSAMGAWPELQTGQTVETVGWLMRPHPPGNPGEKDQRSAYLDRRIRAVMTIRGEKETIHAHPENDRPSFHRTLALVRGWGRHQLSANLPAPLDCLAAALVLGDGAAMSQSEWDEYIRNGVVHVLIIAGLHLGVLATFVWLLLRVLFVRRWAAIIVAILICSYAALTGARPPVMRAAVMVAAVCGATILGRVSRPANTFALAWIVLLLMNPANVVDPGCQFSFFCVAVLVWGCARWLDPGPVDPLDRLAEASRSWPMRFLRRVGRWVAMTYAVTVILGIAVMPLTAAHYHLIPLAGLMIGPPVILLASIALISGFLQLLVGLLLPNVAAWIAVATRGSLSALAAIVDWSDRWPSSHFYVGDVPIWWLVVFVAMIAALLWVQGIVRRPITAFAVILAWACIGLGATLYRPTPERLEATFLAVGHGGCTVMETPDGRVLLFAAGSMSGPEITKRVIAPFLWHRGISRIDEIFLSHADLDHFNGVPALIERFPVGRMSLTPSFSSKPSPGVHEVIKAFALSNVPVRIVMAGDVLTAGELTLDVLHPPKEGPSGPENNRSMVLAVRYRARTILLTGDLDGEGRTCLFNRRRELTDVLMAPHHGGKTANPRDLPDWCRPEVVVACQGPMDRTDSVRKMYESAGCRYLGTWPHGAVTFSSGSEGLRVRTFATELNWRLQTPILAHEH